MISVYLLLDLLPYKSIAVMPAKVYIRSEIGEEKLSDRRSGI